MTALAEGELELAPGEVHVLIGANGSGKSTLCKIIAGATGPDSGVVELDGAPRHFKAPRDAAAVGISVCYQELSLIPQLSVAQNIFLGREKVVARTFVNSRKLNDDAARLMERFQGVAGENFFPNTLVSDLSADQQQLVEILKTAAEDGRIVIFDEPTSSLDNRQVELFFGLVREMKSAGKAIVFISHRMRELFEIGDRMTVMRNGRTVGTFDAADATEGQIIGMMIGNDIVSSAQSPQEKSPQARSAKTVLQADNLTGRTLNGVSLDLAEGEILGLGGLHGQGQSALLRSLFGADPAADGIIKIDGKVVKVSGPRAAMALGLAYVSGDRGRDGTLSHRPVFENLALARLNKSHATYIDVAAVSDQVLPVAERLKLKYAGLGSPISQLSGGNQQKVVLGRWLAAEPRILLLDDPTKGIDLQTKKDLYALLAELCLGGMSILFYSSDDTELLSVSDRVLVFADGQVVDELAGERLTEFELNQAAFASSASAEATA
ncbi:MAG: sugar ABC transporter ATP-binding protein [Alphaproteobacteria bacterium]|nr:sugar ABC transporter ATP-binding protein [Alphaproteobacteria bacterium]